MQITANKLEQLVDRRGILLFDVFVYWWLYLINGPVYEINIYPKQLSHEFYYLTIFNQFVTRLTIFNQVFLSRT